jgi:hypothetical protein
MITWLAFSRNLWKAYPRSANIEDLYAMTTASHACRCYVRIARWLLIAILALFNDSCARIIAPAGGPEDVTPPQLIRVSPAQDSIGFKGKVIRLIFDKEIEVRDVYNKLVVTPRLRELDKRPSYTYSIRGKTLKLTLHVPLEEGTTYTFNFNDAIQDITEGNIAAEPVLTFSTGDYVDAMYVTGKVNHLMTQLPAEKVLVALYKADNKHLNILNSLPDYVTRTDREGYFKLDHIKKGQYYMYASTNKEYQLLGNPGVDEYGFLKHPIDLTVVPRDNVALFILKADVRDFKLQRQQPQDQYFELSFNKPVEHYTLALVRQSKRLKKCPTLYSKLVADKQIIRVYNTFGRLEEDGLKAHLTAKDILGNVIEENVSIHFREGNYQNHPASYTFEPTSGTAIRPDFTGTMTVSKPIKEIVADYLCFDLNGQEAVRIDTQDLQFNAQRDVITIKKQLNLRIVTPPGGKDKASKGEERLVLHMAQGAFVTVEGDSSKAMSYVYTFRHPEEFGIIKGTVTTEAPGFIVQLLDLKNNIIDSVRNKHNYQFNAVAPGSYRLRLLVLRDKEGEWNFGDIYERREPDPVVFYPADVAVIANWEIEGIDFAF